MLGGTPDTIDQYHISFIGKIGIGTEGGIMNSLTMCSGQGVDDTMRSERKKSVVVKDIRYDPHSRNLLYHTLLKWNLEAL